VTVELLDQRVLGAVRFTDATTGLDVRERLRVDAEGVRWIRTARALWVIASAPGLAAHETSFAAPPSSPTSGAAGIELRVSDAAGAYLPRRATVPLPRDAAPESASEADSLFRPIVVRLFPAPAAPTWPGWAVVRASAPGVAGALILVVRQSDGTIIGRGVTDERGEALVAVQGIPSTIFGDDEGPVVVDDVAVSLELVHDPDAEWPPDPDELERRRDDLRVRATPAALASRRVVNMAV
jgi:hypothetical protein